MTHFHHITASATARTTCALLLLFAIGCSNDETNGDGANGTDGNSGDNSDSANNQNFDSSGNGDADTDTDADADTDADSDADADPQIDTACGTTTIDFYSAAPTAMLVIDRSGSMGQDFGGQTRWEVAREALVDPQTGFIAQLDAEIQFGIAMYAGAQDSGDGGGGWFQGDGDQNTGSSGCPYLEGVNPELNNYPSIANIYLNSEPLSNTPTPAAIRAVTEILLADPSPSNKAIILVTDGLPDTCSNPDSQDDAAKRSAVVAVNNAFVQGIDSYVISVGEQDEAAHFQELADAGAGAASGQGQYFAAEDQAALVNALATVMSDIRSCKLNLRGQIAAGKQTECTVAINGSFIPFEQPGGVIPVTDSDTVTVVDTSSSPVTDTASATTAPPSDTATATTGPALADGYWQLNTASQIELMNSACDAIQEGDITVDVVCPCDTFIPTQILVE